MQLLTLSLALAAAVPAQPSPAAPACRLQVIPDYTLVVVYKAVLRPSPACPNGTELRVRKSSTLNTRRNGAPYQPIQPLVGAWTLTDFNSTVPSRNLWTSLNWRWEYYDPTTLSPRTGLKGIWRGAEVLRAAP